MVTVAEVVSAKGQADRQTQAKDVIIYDSAYSPIFGWDETGFHLFPIESVYAITEVKKASPGDLLRAAEWFRRAREVLEDEEGGEDVG